jgi:hypothetical protein
MYIDFKKIHGTSRNARTISSLHHSTFGKKDFEASYVDQQIAAAGAWNSILGFHPLMSPTYPSRLMIVFNTSPIELLEKRSQPHTPCSMVTKVSSTAMKQINSIWFLTKA